MIRASLPVFTMFRRGKRRLLLNYWVGTDSLTAGAGAGGFDFAFSL